MSGRETYDQVVAHLNAGKANIRCDELEKQLEKLGFRVRDGRRGGHKLFFHDGLPSFRSASYNCGHGKNPEIKRGYISNILNILKEYENEIIDYLERIEP